MGVSARSCGAPVLQRSSPVGLAQRRAVPTCRHLQADGYTDTVSGPEVELMKILKFIDEHPIKNVIFISGDTHFPFSISYDPFKKGTPLVYEVGATPLQALCLPCTWFRHLLGTVLFACIAHMDVW